MEGCIFCKIVKGEIPCVKIYEDDRVLSFADINPILDGHTLVIPKHHAENIWEISADDLAAVHRASKKVAQAIKDTMKCDGIACLQLNGRAVNQVVMHYHLHLLPRSDGQPALAMTNWDLKPGNMDSIKKIAGKIASAIK